MGEEVDAVLMKKVKETQEVLGQFVRKPPLTEKHLMKPPFRFLHDIITNVMDTTGFFQGLYDGSELDPSTITTRETKTAWMTKLVECLKLATGEDVEVKVSKILAGQEPAKTNELLICLGNALAKGVSSDAAVAKITGKNPNPAAASKTSKPADPAKEKKKKEPAGATKIKEASPYGQSLQKKPGKAPSKSKPTDGDKTKRVSKPVEVPPVKTTQGRQSKAGMSSSPPKAATKGPRQPSSDRLTGPRSRRESLDKTSPGRSTTVLRGERKDGRRLSNQQSIEESAPTSLVNESAAEVIDESGGGSRRGSLTSGLKETRGPAATYRQPGSQRGSLSGPSGADAGGGDSLGAFASPEAHADDAEQEEFMGELEFLLKKHATNDGGHDIENDGGDIDDDHDDNGGVGAGGEGDIVAKADKGDNGNFPGSASNKESIPGKSITPNQATVPAVTTEPAADDETVLDDDNDGVKIEKNVSPTTSLPTSRKPSAGPSTSRVQSSSPSKTEPPVTSPSPSTSALSVTNAVLGTLSPVPSSAKPKTLGIAEPVEKVATRPPTARPHTSQMRPGGSTANFSVPRPPSARPAPPRPKTALFQDKDEPTFRPTTAKVQNVLLDEDEEADDENYIVHEVAAAPEQASGELETADLGIKGNILEENIDLILDPEQRGILVNQMLDAQSRLEDGSRLAGKKTEIEREEGMGEKDRLRWREDAAAEVEKLKNLMQLMARNANPLGKLMDFVQEDVDAMQRDLNKWREESRKLDQSLEAAQEETEQSMEPLRRRMAELDETIRDRLDAIAATKMTIFRQEERIRKVLMGLDKVKPRSGNEPKLTSADITNLIEPDGGYDFGGNKVYFKKSSPSSPSPV